MVVAKSYSEMKREKLCCVCSAVPRTRNGQAFGSGPQTGNDLLLLRGEGHFPHLLRLHPSLSFGLSHELDPRGL